MPVTYSIDTSLRIVYTTWVGAVTMEEALAHNDALRVDPNFEPDMRQLSDARLTTSTVSAEGIRRLAGESPFGQGSVRAILVAGDAVFGVSRMYEAQAHEAGNLKVFKDLGAARAWLGLPVETGPGADAPEK